MASSIPIHNVLLQYIKLKESRFYLNLNYAQFNHLETNANQSTPKGIRIPVCSVKGSCPRPLDDGGKNS